MFCTELLKPVAQNFQNLTKELLNNNNNDQVGKINVSTEDESLVLSAPTISLITSQSR